MKGNDDGGEICGFDQRERGKSKFFECKFKATSPDCTTADFTSLILHIFVYVLQCTFSMHTVLACLYKNKKKCK